MTKAAFKGVLEEILQVPPGSLSDSDSRDSIENWSSLADVEIMTVISSELGIDAELLDYETVGDLMRLLEEEAAFSA
jgi:acyl carrier protein